MELALTLISIASFFALVLAWTILPGTFPTSVAVLTQLPTTGAQVAH
jgi:hypothetical protein